MSKHYQEAGVTLSDGRNFIKSIAPLLAGTQKNKNNLRSLADVSHFAAINDIRKIKKNKHPLVVTATDGVGTKLYVADLFHDYSMIGYDLVAMVGNDILTTGASMQIFLDYLSCEKLQPRPMRAILLSLTQACKLSACALVGGETAEHPGVGHGSAFDIAGFGVGFIDKTQLIDGKQIAVGDVILGLPSSGVHANGFSLIRKLFLEDNRLPKSKKDRKQIFDLFVKPATVVYHPILSPILTSSVGRKITGMAHITGGGFFENIPRILPGAVAAQIDLDSWQPPSAFTSIRERGNIDYMEMFSVFNMGIGYIVICKKNVANKLLKNINRELKKYPLPLLHVACRIGEVVPRESKPILFKNLQQEAQTISNQTSKASK